MVDLNFWWEIGNLSIINGTDIPHQISPVLFLCSLFWPSFSLSFFFSPISFYLLSSCNCRIYKGKIGIRSSPNSGRDPGTFFFFSEKEGACFFSSVQSLSRVQLCSLMDCSMPAQCSQTLPTQTELYISTCDSTYIYLFSSLCQYSNRSFKISRSWKYFSSFTKPSGRE